MNRILVAAYRSNSFRSVEAVKESLHSMKRWYSAKLDSHPVMTKAITTGVIAGCGDLLCQGITKSKDEIDHEVQSKASGVEKATSFGLQGYDPMRTLRFVALGTVFVAPTCHYWYNGLATWFPGTCVKQVTKRVATDQLTWTPLFMVIWLSSMWAMEGYPLAKLPDRLKQEFPDVMTATWICWVPAQFATFFLVPLRYQVLATNGIEFFWNAYLSYFTAGKSH